MSAAQKRWTNSFYWTGIIMAAAALAAIVASNTELAWRFEHAGFPLSWVFAGAAVLALGAFEFCDCTFTPPRQREDRSDRRSTEWEAEQFDPIRRDAAGMSLSTPDSASV